MKLVFVDVDMQNDFCEPNGSLYVPGSPNDLVRALVRRAVDDRIPILGSVDSHAFDAWEFASSKALGPDGAKPNFPDHCVKGTWGWLKVVGTLPPRFRFVPELAGKDHAALAHELSRGEAHGLYFEKEVYSLFANPNAEPVIRELVAASAEPPVFVVFGVATDYCVRAAALGLAQRGYPTWVVGDAIRGIGEATSSEALLAMKNAGCRVVSASELGV